MKKSKVFFVVTIAYPPKYISTEADKGIEALANSFGGVTGWSGSGLDKRLIDFYFTTKEEAVAFRKFIISIKVSNSIQQL